MLAWLSVWGVVQICIWPRWCYCHSVSSVKSRFVLVPARWVISNKVQRDVKLYGLNSGLANLYKREPPLGIIAADFYRLDFLCVCVFILYIIFYYLFLKLFVNVYLSVVVYPLEITLNCYSCCEAVTGFVPTAVKKHERCDVKLVNTIQYGIFVTYSVP